MNEIIINDRKYKLDHNLDFGDAPSHRISPSDGSLSGEKCFWIKVSVPTNLDYRKIDSNWTKDHRIAEYYKFNDWFEKTCVGYWQYIDSGSFFFSNKEDVIKYYLGYYD